MTRRSSVRHRARIATYDIGTLRYTGDEFYLGGSGAGRRDAASEPGEGRR